MSINVLDLDFHNFDLDRAESSFREDQIWATYDGDGMRRYYARIQKLKPVGTLGLAHGMILVFPGNMEVWALYRNWSPDWNQLTSDEVINKYDMVEMLDDFTEELRLVVSEELSVPKAHGPKGSEEDS
ncbi:hypothetical protein M0R45_023239 [Rubus argutus]|uniref:DUF3444 domain-containing protein n=1 Tax=Rubus argutus TaxID=59490 RepID=A0AAW1WP79_RUBAR